MLTYKGDFVRFNNPDIGVPLSAVWRAFDSDGGLKLYPHNDEAVAVYHRVTGLRFKPEDFEVVAEFHGQWIPVNPAKLVKPADTVPNEALPKTMFADADAVTNAEVAVEWAALAAADIARRLKDAKKLEAERQQELRKAKAAKAKADKEAAARAKVEEAREALSARLHADRLLALATMALIHEVIWLNNGGAERPAAAGIANHADQLQPLARSYGYRIAKPSAIALVVKL